MQILSSSSVPRLLLRRPSAADRLPSATRRLSQRPLLASTTSAPPRRRWPPALTRRDAPLVDRPCRRSALFPHGSSRYMASSFEVIDGKRDTTGETVHTAGCELSSDCKQSWTGDIPDCPILPGSTHRDGSMYRNIADTWKHFYLVDDRSETRLESMMLQDPTDCVIRNGVCMMHICYPMLQIFSLKLAKLTLDGGLVQLYGYIAVRDNIDALLNYIVNISRDDPIIVEQGSVINMTGPKRGIELFGDTLIEYDMRIKTGEQEKDDLQLIDGASVISYESIANYCPFICRFHGDCGAIDMEVSRFHRTVEATVEVLISEVKGCFTMRLGCFVSGLHEEIRLFDGAIVESRGLKKSVVAVVKDTWMDLKFKERFPHGSSSRYMASSLEIINGKRDTTGDTVNITACELSSNGKQSWVTDTPDYYIEDPADILPDSSHRDGSLYRDIADSWKSEFRVDDRNETQLEAMMLSNPTNCKIRNGECMRHRAYPMLQIFSLKLAKLPMDGGMLKLYGYVAVRDNIDLLLNYVVNISRDDPIIVEQGSLIHMAGPKRGIELFSDTLIEFDMRIKTGEQEKDDLQLIDGVSFVSYRSITNYCPFICRIHGDGGAVDLTMSRFNDAVEATVEVLISEVKGCFTMRLGCFVSGLHEETRLFDGAIVESRGLKRSVVAVVKDTWMDLKFKVGAHSSIAEHCCSFKANLHGHATQEIKTDFALISVNVTWSTLFRLHMFNNFTS
ncbi:hypothetical protein ACP70R_029615 [Stipagrostis hirtigluma subsp. patula]